MITTPSQFLELQRVQVNALNTVGHALITAAEKVSSLNLTAGRSAMDSATEAVQSLTDVKEPNDLIALSGAAAKPSVEKFVGYTRELIGIANGVSAEIGKVVEQQIADSNRRVAELLEFASKNAPAGSEQAGGLPRRAPAPGEEAFVTTPQGSRPGRAFAPAHSPCA